MSDVTQILGMIEAGDTAAAARLLPMVYDELRRLAAARLAHERADQTLQATALVHEAYMRLVTGPQHEWYSRRYFFSAAAEAMRRILIDRARARGAVKRGGGQCRIKLDQDPLTSDEMLGEFLDLDAALAKLATEDAPKAELVKLRFFAGLTLDEAAAALDISPATADRYWRYARAWLYQKMSAE